MKFISMNCIASFKLSILVVTCGSAIAPDNAQLKNAPRTTYNYGDEVEVTCNLGYHLNGNNTIKCEADGRWSVREPFCQGK